MRRQAILARQIFDGGALRTGLAVLLEDECIAGVVPRNEVPGTFAIIQPDHAAILTPGLIDLQVNGGGGVLFNDALNSEGVRQIAAAHRKLGTAWIQPTVISGGTREIAAALSAVRAAIAAGIPGILGLHVEGPFLNPNRRGIHPADAIRALTDADLELLTAPFPGALMLTLAPEMIPERPLRALAKAGVILMAGHSEATVEEMSAAAAIGLSGVTHLFNAMPPIAARAPGPAGAALGDATYFASLIVDGLHVHTASLRLALAAKGVERLCLVSDAMPTVGSAIDSFRIGNTLIRLHDGKLTGPDGTLGGAHLTLAEAAQNARRLLGLPPAQALRMATATPAALIRCADRLGRLCPGQRADLALFNDTLGLLGTWNSGIYTPATAEIRS